MRVLIGLFRLLGYLLVLAGVFVAAFGLTTALQSLLVHWPER